VLAKIFGFYTIECVDYQSQRTLKADVLVMENLFYGSRIAAKYDLSGDPTRHADTMRIASQLFWDADWLDRDKINEHQVYAYCKKVLQEGIRNDTRFLANCNVSNYSLLIGVDEKHKELVAGLIDYTNDLVPTYAPSMSRTGSQVTSRSSTIPRSLPASDEASIDLHPDDYKERIRRAVDDYFRPIPGTSLS
jgi:1-phosphatidylinositol-3-phosphate 5-kinase